MFLELDGAEGEGGGQILRTALALSIASRTPFKIVNIRANRSQPGLRPQHVACVRAAASICNGQYKGGTVGSSVLVFEPGACRSGTYSFGVGTAGATSLVLHTVALPLALFGQGESCVTITGGTHVPNSPSFDMLDGTWAPWMRRIGLEIALEMVRPGFYPRGGGQIEATIRPSPRLRGLNATAKVEIGTALTIAAVADLPEKIASTMARRMKHGLQKAGVESHGVERTWTNGPGAVAAVQFRQLPVPATFAAIGERGKPAEIVADEAVDEALRFRAAGWPVDEHSADQLLLPLAVAKEPSRFRVSHATRHLRTNAETIAKFIPARFEIDEELGHGATVSVTPAEFDGKMP